VELGRQPPAPESRLTAALAGRLHSCGRRPRRCLSGGAGHVTLLSLRLGEKRLLPRDRETIAAIGTTTFCRTESLRRRSVERFIRRRTFVVYGVTCRGLGTPIPGNRLH
jgi:hypothetical protein